MNKCKPPQLALALSGCIMALATQNDYVPLEIMTDCAKRSYFTHLALFGGITLFVSVVKRDMPVRPVGP